MMRILFICDTSPFNANMGNAQRTSVILQAFLNNSVQVDIAYIGNKEEPKPTVLPENVSLAFWNNGRQWKRKTMSKLKRHICINSNGTSAELQEIIKNIVNDNCYEFVFCRYIGNARLAGIFYMKNKILLDIDDLPEKKYKSSLPQSNSFLRSLYHKYFFHCLKNETKKCIKKSSSSFLPNREEAIEYKTQFLPNISTIHKDVSETISYNHTVLFIGYMSWEANHKGVEHFINNCWNDVISQVPDAKFVIAGKGLPDEYIEKWSVYNNIEYLGFVDDIFDFYSKGNIVICPIYAGAGTNIKVIEAMSMGKACVLSPTAARGFEDILRHCDNVMIAYDDLSFTNHVVTLLKNDTCCKEIAQNALKTANSFFSQGAIDEIIRDVLKK